MNDNTLSTLFHEAGLCYHQGQYQPCVALLNDCLLLAPNALLLLSNRAIAKHRLHLYQQSLNDLQLCIAKDHLNYVAHFNLFSLHLLDQHKEIAFKQLCRAISSAYTFLAREQRDMSSAQRSLHYCFNNKEALLLKGLLHLNLQQYTQTLNLLTKALDYEHSPAIRTEVVSIILWLQQLTGKQQTQVTSKLIGGGQYQLQTDLQLPSAQEYEATVADMITEFSRVYVQLGKATEQSRMLSRNSSEALGSSLMESSFSSIKEDLAANCVTAHNSMLASESDCQASEQERSFTRTSYTLLVERDSTNWLDRSSQNSIIPQESSSVADNWSSSMISSDRPTEQSQKPLFLSFFMHSAQLTSPTASKPLENLFLVLQYNQKENGAYQTSLCQSSSGVYSWNEPTEPFVLSSCLSKLELKLYQKQFDCFQDKLVGSGETQVGELGTSTLDLLCDGDVSARVVLDVALIE